MVLFGSFKQFIQLNSNIILAFRALNWRDTGSVEGLGQKKAANGGLTLGIGILLQDINDTFALSFLNQGAFGRDDDDDIRTPDFISAFL